MNNSANSLVYIIYAGLNILNLFFGAFIMFLYTYKTDSFILATFIIMLFLITNIAIYGIFRHCAIKYNWNFWINFILCNLIGVVLNGILLITAIGVVIPYIEPPTVY